VLSVLLSFGHCVVCSSVFWSLCCLFFCLLVIVLSVLLSFGHCVVCSSIYGFSINQYSKYKNSCEMFNCFALVLVTLGILLLLEGSVNGKGKDAWHRLKACLNLEFGIIQTKLWTVFIYASEHDSSAGYNTSGE
jgi:phosphatidylglycerophosphate synthase